MISRPRVWRVWQLGKFERYAIPYLSADQNWLATFFGLTGMSVTDIDLALQDMRPILYGELPCTADFFHSVNIWTDLNIAYYSKLMDLIDYDAISGIVRAFYNSRWTGGGYIETMDYINRSLSHSLATSTLTQIDLPDDAKEKLLIHFENNYTWARVCVAGLIEAPTSFDILDAFENVKNAIEFGLPVDQLSKDIVHNAVVGDVDSLEYTKRIVGRRPVQNYLFDRLEAMMNATLKRVDAL